jgi:uncharacterized protein
MVLKTAVIAAGAFAALLSYMVIEPLWLRVRHVKVKSDEVPQSFVGYRIVFISDLHFGRYLHEDRLRRVVRIVNEQQPDLVVMGGDYVSGSARYVPACFSILERIKAADGIYCVLGNHDYRVGAEVVRKAIADSGFHSINNASYWIDRGGQRVLVAGVNDWWEDGQRTDAVLREASPDDFCIMAAHNPDYFATIRDDRVDLALSGHTHGGQVTVFGLYAPVLPIRNPRYRFGSYRLGKEQLYVTSGIGTVSPPLRFFCRPEVVVLELARP